MKQGIAGAMRLILAFSVFFYGVCGTPLPYGYHMRIGVPRAAALRRLEDQRVSGGTQVPSASVIPHHAGIISFLTNGWVSICAGSLISNTRVLTAAHCWFDGRHQAAFFTVVLGSVTLFSGGLRTDTKDVTVHSNWYLWHYTHDIAIIRIATVSYNNNIQAIPLPGMGDVNREFVGMTATVSGFGKTSDAQTAFSWNTVLYQASLRVISNAECQTNFQSHIYGSQVCALGEGVAGACHGDSGGPLTVVRDNKRILIGIVSFARRESCETNQPTVFTRVTAFINWIHWNM